MGESCGSPVQYLDHLRHMTCADTKPEGQRLGRLGPSNLPKHATMLNPAIAEFSEVKHISTHFKSWYFDTLC